MQQPDDVLAVMLEVNSILPRTTIADGNLSEAHYNARATVAKLIDFNRRAAEIARRIVRAATPEEEAAACREMAQLYNADLDAAIANSGEAADGDRQPG